MPKSPSTLTAVVAAAAATVADSRDETPLTWRHTPWFLLVVLTAVNTINWADRQVVPILFPGIRDDLGLSDTQLGIIGGLAFSLVYAVSSFVFGRAADRRIRRNIITLGLVLWSLATAAGAFAVDFTTLFAARFFTGVGEASLYPAAMSLIAERFPVASRGRAMGLFGAAAALGGGLGIGLGGVLAEALGWRNVFLVYGLAGLLLIPLVLALPEQPRKHVDADGENLGNVLAKLATDPRLITIWIAGMMMMAAGIGYAAWIPSFFVRDRGLDVSQAGMLFGFAMLIGGVAGALMGGFGADRARKKRLAGELDVSALAALVAVPVAAGTLAVVYPPVFIACGLLTPMFVFAFFPPLQTVIVEIVPPRQHGLAYAINILFLGGIGTAMGPFVVGAVSDMTQSLTAGIYVSVAGLGLAAILIHIAGRVVRAYAPADE